MAELETDSPPEPILPEGDNTDSAPAESDSIQWAFEQNSNSAQSDDEATESDAFDQEVTIKESDSSIKQNGPPPLPPRPSKFGETAKRKSAPRGDAKFFKIVGSYKRGVLKFVVEELLRRGFRPTRDDSLVSVFWSRSFYNQLSTLQPYQKVNFFPAMAEIARKDYLNRNIKRARSRFGDELFDFWPVGFNLPMEMAALKSDFASNPTPFILKPPLAARGEGIRLVTSMEQIDEMPDYIKAKIPLAQRYIPNPMLFHGHKMTFRLYVTITSWDPLRVYVFPNGLVRICSEKYTTEMDSFQNNLIHLTNYDLQMDKEEAFNAEMPPDAYHDGLRSELRYIFSEIERTKGISTEKLWKDIRKLIACSIIPSEDHIQHWVARKVPYRNNCFEILGYDVLIDETGKPWLLEINHTPSLSPHTEMENTIKRAMLRELMDLVDIGNSALSGLIRVVEKLHEAVKLRSSDDPERYAPVERSWKGKDPDVAQLTRADIWSIVDAELENNRKGSWIRVLPAEDGAYDRLFFTGSRDALLSCCVQRGIDTQELASRLGVDISRM